MAAGRLQAVVATSSLDLGVDWGDIDLVINVGAPKGASRLLQRIGRANHRMDEPSRGVLIPANRFEVLECTAALGAIAENAQDTPPLRTGALDVLLVTDISPKEFVFGKLLGVVYNCKEYLIPPLVLVFYYAALGALARTPPDAGVADVFEANFAPLVAVVGALVVLFAFAVVLGLHVSLRITNSRLAIANTLGTIFFLSVGTLICIYLIVVNGGSFANQWISFIAFLVRCRVPGV